MSQQVFKPREEAAAAIKAELGAYETHRRAAHRSLRLMTPLSMIPAAIAAVVGIVVLFGADEPPLAKDRMQFALWVCLAVALLVSGGFWFAGQPSARLQQSLRNRLLPALFGFVGQIEYSHATTPFTFEYLPKAALPGYARIEYGDVIRGRHKWMRFELFELHLKDAGKGGGNTVFDGIVVGFEIPAEFAGLLMATPRMGAFSTFFRDMFHGRLPELTSGKELLDAGYEFRSDNPAAAEPLVKGALGGVLAGLGREWREPPRLALSNRVGFLLLPTTKDFFELPGIDTPASYDRHIEPMIAELSRLLETALLVRRAMSGRDGPEEEGLLS